MENTPDLDLIGGPFAVIESDPGVFTSLTRRLGINGLELVELYDIEPWAVDHLSPHGLIFCFMYHRDSHRPADFDDPAAERVWFANQLSDDACATHAILNVVLNCPDIDIGDDLRTFRADTEAMSPVMRGLAVTNSPRIRPAHNFLARPSDLRASLSNLTITTFDAEKKKAKEKQRKAVEAEAASKPPPAKRVKVTPTTAKDKGKGKEKETSDRESEEEEETYHFIGYVPAHGKVWELDGLKSGPLEVGELPLPEPSSSNPTQTPNPNVGWMDVARPALRMKMEKYGGSGNDGSNIRFSLLAIVDDVYMKAHDDLELLKRERLTLERQLEPGWELLVDPAVFEASKHVFNVSIPNPNPERSLNHTSSPSPSKTFAKDFGSRKMDRDMKLLKLSSQTDLISAWQECIQHALRAKTLVEDEINKAVRSNTDNVKRVFDYDPLIQEYMHRLHNEGLLNALLDRDNDGKKKRGRKPGTSKGQNR